MSLRKSLDKLKFDVRMADINLKSQLVTSEELNKNRESLPDLKDQATIIDLENSNLTNGADRFADAEMN